MMTKNQALGLEPGVRVKYGREIFIVDHRTDVGTHEEPVLVAESGRRLVGTLFIAHLLSYVDRPQAQLVEPESDPEDSFEDDIDADEQDDLDGQEDSDPAISSAPVKQVDQEEESELVCASEAPAPGAEAAAVEPPASAPDVEQDSAAPVQAQPVMPVKADIPAEELAILEVFEKDEAI